MDVNNYSSEWTFANTPATTFNRGENMKRIEMKVICHKNELLKELKKNRKNHLAIFEEAKKEYFVKAIEYVLDMQDELIDLEEELRNEDFDVSLSLPRHQLSKPFNYVSVYDTAIQMLELHTEDTIELSASEVRNLVQDMWDWQADFLNVAKIYSHSAVNYADSKGL